MTTMYIFHNDLYSFVIIYIYKFDTALHKLLSCTEAIMKNR